MPQLQRVWCPNCGTEWTAECNTPMSEAVAPTCPSCYLPMSTNLLMRSVGELEEQLGALITDARASGLCAESIMQVLHAELQYAVEIGQVGHAINIQLIDLGLDPHDIHVRPVRDRREMLQTRNVPE